MRRGELTPEYNAWRAMIKRCTNPRSQKWHVYGGRGITVCEEWRHNSKAFLEYMGPRPSPKHSLDRYPNNDGNYEPGNVRWATQREQTRNTRRTTFYELNGERKSLSDWLDIYRINPGTFRSRLKTGWTLEDAISIQSRPRRR